ncbi:hypothetical protein SDC9_129414 [bioreactor metagenome]|uniref:Uncharacterized protein n=1 Tax=bioreactor metagenome TaxID=1076179 RepID=A0A645CZR2_9ZZZZ
MPFLEAPPIPPKKLSGTEITSAQGHEITRNISALENHIRKSPLKITGGITASNTADITTNGVYTLANLVMKFSETDFFSDAFSTRSNILATVDIAYCVVTFT